MRISYLFCLIIYSNTVLGKEETFRVHSDLPYLKKGHKLVWDVFYQSDTSFKGDVILQIYKYNDDQDSCLVARKTLTAFAFKKNAKKIQVDLCEKDTSIFCEKKLYEIVKRTGNIAPGSYRTYVHVDGGIKQFSGVYIHQVDSLLDPNSPIRKDISKSIRPKKRSSFLRNKASGTSGHIKGSGAGTAFMHSQKKIGRSVKKRGLTSVPAQRSDKSYVDLYYEDWFAGRYEVQNNVSLSGQIDKMENEAGNKNFNSMTHNELGDPSLFSQFKKINSEGGGQDDIIGTVSLTNNMANAQDPGSGLNNNYYDIKGIIEFPIMGLPVEAEGLYTSQDKGREVKSSYIRVHYSSQKLKDGLRRSVSSYNSKFGGTMSQSAGIHGIYGSAIGGLEAEKKRLLDRMSEEEMAEYLEEEARDTSGLARSAGGKAQPNSTQKTRRKVAELDRKISRYKKLLDQYENTKHFDSSLGYSKTKDIDNTDMSYKQMAKKAGNLLPDGKAKNFVSGLTTFDAGMFSKYGSKYTMAGQMVKGAGFGYDFGFCETSVTVGKTEFAGRSGTVDKYTCYTSKTTFQPFKNQKAGFTYYGYSADKTLYSRDVFYEKVNISAPTFFEPVHILSIDHSGRITKFVTVEGEVASSFRKADSTVLPMVRQQARMAYHFGAEGSIPRTYVTIAAVYDNTGKGFENKTLPFSMSGTEQYKASVRNEFLHSHLIAGVDFNKLIQNNFSSTASNIRWGFDVKTSFKGYPNVGISYKPYSTFHSYSDTFSIPQRPMFGSVWTAKATYQVRIKTTSWHFTTLYNKCMTLMDTLEYGSRTLQAICTYSSQKLMGTLALGRSEVIGAIATPPMAAAGKTDMMSINVSYALNNRVNLNNGWEVGMAMFGLSRYAANGGITYRPKKVPFTVRLAARKSTYKQKEADPWQNVYSACVDITYRFKTRIKK